MDSGGFQASLVRLFQANLNVLSASAMRRLVNHGKDIRTFRLAEAVGFNLFVIRTSISHSDLEKGKLNLEDFV